MTSPRPRALVVGGSLGGLFGANLLLRSGWDVEVFERVAEPLAGRGAGIVTHRDLFRAIERCGVAVDASIGCEVQGRIALAPDGSTAGEIALPQILTAWGRLHRALAAAFPADRYHRGRTLERVEQRGSRVVARFTNGDCSEGDLLVAADGVRSAVRAQFLPGVQPAYAGYVAWRGLAAERDLSPSTRALLFDRFAFCLAEREHMLGYPVAGPTGSTARGERCYNFVWYRPTDDRTELARLCTDATGRVHVGSIPPPLIRPEIVAEVRAAARESLAPQFAEVVDATVQPFFQPIHDLESGRMVFGRVALLGDAAYVARPHCGAGVAKAAADAVALADALLRHGEHVEAALSEYETTRTAAGAALVERGRELGNYLQSLVSPQVRRASACAHHTPLAAMREIAIPLESIG